MKYEQAKHLKLAEFKRFWGVKLETFEQMVEIDSTPATTFARGLFNSSI